MGAIDVADTPTWCQGIFNKAVACTGSWGVFDTTKEHSGCQDVLNIAGAHARSQGAFDKVDVPKGHVGVWKE